MSYGSSEYSTEMARSRARSQCEQAAERLLSAMAAVRARDGSGSVSSALLDRRPSDDAEQASFDSWTQTATALAVELEARAAAHDAARAGGGLAERFGELVASGALATRRPVSQQPEADALGGPATSGLSAEVGPSAEELSGRIAQVLAGVDPGATQHEREQLTELAAEVLSAPPGSWLTMLTDLRACVQQVDRAASQRREHSAHAQALLLSLEALDGTAVSDERAFLGEVVAGSAALTSADVLRVQRVREAAIAEQERAFVAERLARTLSRLGYHVDDRFLGEVRAGRPGFAVLDASDQHAVRVEVGDGGLDYRLVRTVEGDDPDRDRKLEGALCGHMGRFMSDLHPEGVSFRFREHGDPGSRPLEVSRAAAMVTERRQRATRQQPRLRERER